MNIEREIIKKLNILPEDKKIEVLNMINKFSQEIIEDNERRQWNEFSLKSAMRGMEDEESLYSINDLKEKF